MLTILSSMKLVLRYSSALHSFVSFFGFHLLIPTFARIEAHIKESCTRKLDGLTSFTLRPLCLESFLAVLDDCVYTVLVSVSISVSVKVSVVVTAPAPPMAFFSFRPAIKNKLAKLAHLDE